MLSQVSEIEVVDPRPEALRVGRERIVEVEERQHPFTMAVSSATSVITAMS